VNFNSGISSKTTALSKLDPDIAFATGKDKFSEQSSLSRQSLSKNSVRVVMQLGASICLAKTKPETKGHTVLEIFGMGARLQAALTKRRGRL
jgi:hypothetical protein